MKLKKIISTSLLTPMKLMKIISTSLLTHMNLKKIISTSTLIHMKLYIYKKSKIFHYISQNGWYAFKQNKSKNQLMFDNQKIYQLTGFKGNLIIELLVVYT